MLPLPTSTPHKSHALSSPYPPSPSKEHPPLSSSPSTSGPRRNKATILTLLFLSSFYYLYTQSASSSSRNPSPHYALPNPIGVPLGFNSSGSFGILDPNSPSYISSSQSPSHEPGLTSLGLAADLTYHLSPSEPSTYYSNLTSFIKTSFPNSLQPSLLSSLNAYFPPPSAAINDKGEYTYPPARSDLPPMIDHKNIFQTAKLKTNEDLGKWTDPQNVGWKWRMLGDAEADRWVSEQFSSKQEKGEKEEEEGRKSLIEQGWEDLGLGILRSDALRYLVLLMEGGVYSDMDTKCMKPIENWGTTDPKAWRKQDKTSTLPSMIIGVEADVGTREDWHDWWPRPLQLSQWTITSSPHHPILLDVLRRILLSTARARAWLAARDALVGSLEADGKMSDARECKRANVLEFKGGEEGWQNELGPGVSVMEWTGPGVWTDAVFAYLKARHNFSWPALKEIKEPLRVGEITILPVTGFSPGVGLFGAQPSWHWQAMVLHNFEGSWKPKEGE